ncbi:MAG TPA: hypothetical protein VMU01_10250 [Rhizomicrobium sp.]|nr:hypothetical protein [Rhizomicrobium sp.]
MWVRRLPAALPLLLLAACLNFQTEYPEGSWPKRLYHGSCAGIAGVYANRGDMIPNNYADHPQAELVPFFFDHWTPDEYRDKFSKADHVVLAFGDGVLTAQVLKGDSILATARFSEKDKTLACKQDGAVIRETSGWAHGRGNPLAGVEYSSFTLIATADQSLIIKSEGGGTGLVFMLVPVSASSTTWFHFPRWQP